MSLLPHKISFYNVVPEPLQGRNFESSQIWDTQFEIDLNKNYLVNAPSGKGKSTLLSIIYGLRSDYKGAVMLGDTNVRKLSINQWSGIRTDLFSFVFQELRLFPEFTAIENLHIKARLSGQAQTEKINNMAEAFGLTDRLSIPTKLLSYGERQRIAIIRALLQPFKLLLLDEPFSNLDANNIAIASQLISDACKANDAGLIIASLGEAYLFNYHQTLFV